jgi:hypothetical protein
LENKDLKVVVSKDKKKIANIDLDDNKMGAYLE